MRHHLPPLVSILTGALVLFLVIPLFAPTVMSPVLRSDCIQSAESRWLGLSTPAWCPSYDQSSNAFFLWRPSVVSTLVASTLGSAARVALGIPTPSLSAYSDFLAQSLILLVGLVLLLFQILSASSWAERFIATSLAFLGTAGLMFVFGSDQLRGAALGSTALLAAAMHYDLRRNLHCTAHPGPTRNFPALTAIAALFSMFHAHQLSLLCVLAAWWIVRFLPGWTRPSESKGEFGLVSHPGNRGLVIGLALSLFSLLLVPGPMLPWYPQGSQVVPDDEIPGMLRPFFGPVPAVPFIDRWGLRDWSVAPYQMLLALIVLLTILLLIRGRHPGRLLVYSALPLGLLLLSVRLPEPVSVISPLLVIPRVLPPLFLIPLEPIVLALTTIGVLIVASSFQSTALGLCAPLVLLLLAHVLPVPPSEAPADLPFRPNLSVDTQNRHYQLMRSPSAFVLRAHRWDALSSERNWILERQEVIIGAEYRRLEKSEVSIEVSSHPERAERMFDGRAKSRWTSGGGKQSGKEWISIRFNQPLQLDGIELYLGPYVTDFPRGLRLRALPACDELTRPHPELPVVAEYPRWYGGLDFTPQGYPYFKGRYFTRVVFPETLVVQCLLAEQIAENEGSDWSIAEIRVAEASNKN